MLAASWSPDDSSTSASRLGKKYTPTDSSFPQSFPGGPIQCLSLRSHCLETTYVPGRWEDFLFLFNFFFLAGYITALEQMKFHLVRKEGK